MGCQTALQACQSNIPDSRVRPLHHSFCFGLGTSDYEAVSMSRPLEVFDTLANATVINSTAACCFSSSNSIAPVQLRDSEQHWKHEEVPLQPPSSFGEPPRQAGVKALIVTSCGDCLSSVGHSLQPKADEEWKTAHENFTNRFRGVLLATCICEARHGVHDRQQCLGCACHVNM